MKELKHQFINIREL